MQTYELMVLLAPSSEGGDFVAVAKALEAVMKKVKGKVMNFEELGERPLAYKVKGFISGLFGLYTLELDPANVKRTNKQLQLEKDLLRYLLVRVEEK